MTRDHTRETSIVLLRPLAVPWLRELTIATTSPTAKPRMPHVTLYAYSTTRRDPGGIHVRRAWVRRGDEGAYEGRRDWPREAVRPSSIAPGIPSTRMGDPRTVRP